MVKKLALAVSLCILAIFAFSQDGYAAEMVKSGSCGENVNYTLYDDGELVISGTGNMYDYGASIYLPWHSNIGDIEKVTIENGVTSIGDYVFSFCDNLTSVTIPGSVTSIGKNAFENSALTSVVIPGSVTVLGNRAFRDCTALTSVTIGGGVSKIGDSAFYNCSSLEYIIIGGDVTSVGYATFFGCSGLTDVFCVNAKESIDIDIDNTRLNSAYWHETDASVGIVKVELGTPENGTVSAPFKYAAKGETVVIEVTPAEGYKLKCLTVDYGSANGNEVTIASSGDFDSVTVSAEFADTNPVVNSGSCGTDVNYNLYEDGELVISGTGDMNDYDDSDFSSRAPWYSVKNKIKKVTIAEGVTSVGDEAFYKCTNLTSVTIGNDVITIGNYAFSYCDHLTGVTIGDSVTYIEDYAFYNCSSLTSVTIPDSVTDIGYSAFCGCESLTSVTIGNSVTSIGDWAFGNCTSLTSVAIPDSVTYIESSVFEYCTSLTSVTIPDSVTDIESSAFESCTSLTSVTIPDSVTYIDSFAFYGCTSLAEIVVDEDNAYYSNDEYGVLFNKDKTELILFPAGSPLTEYTIPDSVTKIRRWAFEGCSSLEAVVLGSRISTIDSYTFDGCTSLTDVFCVNAKESIEIDSDNTRLNSAYWHETDASAGVVKVELGTTENGTIAAPFKYAAKGETVAIEVTPAEGYKLKSLTAGHGTANGNEVTIASSGDFDSVTVSAEFELIYLDKPIAKSGSCGMDVNYILYEDGELYIYGTGEMTNYADGYNTPWWVSRYSIEKITIENGVTSIGSSAFEECIFLTSVTVPDGVISIGNNAFGTCSGLASVTVGDDVTSIGDFAFFNCESLTSITLGDSVASIGSCAFENCVSLTSVIFPSSMTSIGWSAFYCCESLTYVVIGSEVSSIGQWAFDECYALTDVFCVNAKESIGIESDNYYLTNAYWHETDASAGIVKVELGTTENGTIATPFKYAAKGETVAIEVTPAEGYKLKCLTVDCGTANGSSVTIAPSGDFDTVTISAEFEFATVKPVLDSGSCGENANYILYEDGELYIYGSGDMTNYASGNDTPWWGSRDLIEKVTVEEGITGIGDFSFYGCPSLIEAEFMGNAPEIGTYVFNSAHSAFVIYFHEGTSGWTTPEWNGYKAVCIDDPGEYSILDENFINAQGILFTLNDVSMTAIVGNNSSSSNNSGYLGIGGGNVVIPATVTYGGNTYKVIGIGVNAFKGNHHLKEVSIGANISSVDSTAFIACPNFEAFKIDPASIYYSVSDGILYDVAKYYLYCCPPSAATPEFTVPASVKAIGQHAFYGCKAIETLTVGEGVTSIGKFAFAECTGLEEMTLPFIGGSRNTSNQFTYVFGKEDRWGILDHVAPESLKTVTITDDTLVWSAFSGCSYIEEIFLAGMDSSVPGNCFKGCTALRLLDFGTGDAEEARLVLPEKVTTIGSTAFSDCDAFTHVVIHDGITSIGAWAFDSCGSVIEFTVDERNANYTSDKWGVLYNKDLTSLIAYPAARKWPYYNVADTVTKIESYAFNGCANLVNLYIPRSVVNMNNSIINCAGLTVCAYVDSYAFVYAGENNINAWPMDNYELQGIEIYSLPEQLISSDGDLSLEGLYMAANYGGRMLQLEDYDVSLKQSAGRQYVEVSADGYKVTFNVVIYDESEETLADFGEVEPGEGELGLAVVYDSNGRMIMLQNVIIVGGRAVMVIDNDMDAAIIKLYLLDAGRMEAVCAPILPR